MAQQETLEVAEVLARLAKAEQEAADNAAAAGGSTENGRLTRAFLEGEVTGLRGAQKLVRELADWPVDETPLLVEWPAPEEPLA
jgi:hypothetical protein